MSRMACMSGRRSTQNAAAKWAAWVHSGLGSDRSIKPAAIRWMSESDVTCAMMKLLEWEPPTESKQKPRRRRGLRELFEGVSGLLGPSSGVNARNHRLGVVVLLL